MSKAFATLLLVASGWLASAPLSAQSWGQIVTGDVVLQQDLVYDGLAGYGLWVQANGVTIDLNGHTIDGLGFANDGIFASGQKNLTIRNGTIRGCNILIRLQGTSITEVDSGGHLIENCVLEDAYLIGSGTALKGGIGVMLAMCEGGEIRNCTLRNLEGDGLRLQQGVGFRVEDCHLSNIGSGSYPDGSGTGGAIYVSGSDILIRNNRIEDVSLSGLRLNSVQLPIFPPGGDAAVLGNTFEDCMQRPGFDQLHYAVVTVYPQWPNLWLLGNRFRGYGASFGSADPRPYAVELQNVIDDNEIRFNLFEGDPGTGAIRVRFGVDPLEVHGNRFQGNGAFAIETVDANFVYDIRAGDNWWGDPSGPSGAGPGTGDAIVEVQPGHVNLPDWKHIALTADNWTAGQANSVTVDFANPGARVDFVASLTGFGSTSVAGGAVILQLDKPLQRLATVTASATGRAQANFPVPLKARGRSVFLQAIEQSSAALRTTVAARITIE